MTDWEAVTCQAERDYDAHREEELLMSTHTADEHVDASKCQDFMDTVLRYSSNDVLKHMQGLIIEELSARPHEVTEGERFLDRFMKEAHEIEDMKEPF